MKKILLSVLAAVIMAAMLSGTAVKAGTDVDERGWLERNPQYDRNVKDWIKSSSRSIVLNGVAEGRIEKTMETVVNDALTTLGINQGTYGGALFNYIMSQDTKGELLTAALNGDSATMEDKTASLMADFICKKIGFENGGDIMDVINDASKGEDIAEQALNLTKSIEKKIFPEIDAMEKFAILVDATFDIWANDYMEEVYSKYSEWADSNGEITDSEWQLLYGSVKGAWARYNSKDISETAIREKFEERARNSRKIAETADELEKLVKVWDRDQLLNPFLNNYPDDWKIEDRLKSLYEIHEMMKKNFLDDGWYHKGDFFLSDDEFLEELLYQWVVSGTDRDEFYRWLEEHGIEPKKGTEIYDKYKEFLERGKNAPSEDETEDETKDLKDDKDKTEDDDRFEDGELIWCFVGVESEVEESGNGTGNKYYTDIYNVSGESYYHHAEFNEGRDHEEADFYITWSAPPTMLKQGEVVTMDVALTAVGDTEIGFSEYINVESDTYVDLDSYYYGISFTDVNDDKYFYVDTSPNFSADKTNSATVSGSMPKDRAEGEKAAILINVRGADIYYVYVLREYAKAR